jgi:drug/metabolite transporter (DMT)-like permease
MAALSANCNSAELVHHRGAILGGMHNDIVANAVPPSQALRASLLMLLSACLFAGMAITIRLASRHVHAFEIAFFRNFFGLVFALPLLFRGGAGLLKTKVLPLYFLRCTIGLGAMLTGFWALVNLPLSQAIALNYTTPLFVAIGAALFLGEAIRARRISALVVGFAGTLVILKVWNAGASWLVSGVWIAILSSALGASAAISIKFLSRTESAEAIVFYMVLIMTPLSLLPALYVWSWPDPLAWLWLCLTGAFGTCAHIAMTRAYKLGEVSALTPINFVQLPVVCIAAWLLFHEVPDRFTVIGAVIVFAATLYIAHREVVLARRAVTDTEILGG